MNYLPKITKDMLRIYNASNGSIYKTITLPGNADYSYVISGDFVIVGIVFKNGTQRSRTYDMKTGQLKSDLAL
jgi:hypothetical protein|tara:strand:+ start:252 stop:470 length:219 start_codon:yes stop_codon:yes gene_type:complete